jgi:inward rectifier potassium channel
MEKKTLMFRLGNARSSSIVDADVRAVVIVPEISSEEFEIRKLYDIKVERSYTPIFGISFTAMHVINDEGPIYGFEIQNFEDKDIIFIISFTGTEDAISKSVHAKKTYFHDQIVKGKKFQDILSVKKNGQNIMDYVKFHDVINE